MIRVTQPPGPTQVTTAEIAAPEGRPQTVGGARAPRPPEVRPWEWALLGVVVTVVVWSLARVVGVGDMLGHDEAVYAARARTWLAGEPTTSWFPHRAPGLPVLGVPLLALGLGTAALRAVGVAFAVLGVVAVWVLARRIGGPVAAPVAAAAVAFAPPLLDHGARYLTDLPATAVVVTLMAVVVWQAERDDGPGPGLLWAAPLAAGALYLRFGAALPLVLVAGAGLAVWPRLVLRGWRWVTATAVLTAGLLLPHLIGAVEAFGTPWGRVAYTATLTRTDTPGGALATYLGQLPAALAGAPAGVLMLIGLVGLPAVLAVRRRWDGAARTGAFAWTVAVADAVAMGVTAEPDVRFVFVAVALLCVAGAGAVGLVVPHGRSVPAVALAATAVVALIGVMVTTPTVAQDRAAGDERYAAMRAAARVVVADRLPASADGRAAADAPIGAALPADVGAPCVVVSSYVPQIEWLTGCTVYAFDAPLLSDPDAADRAAWLLLLRDGKRQPVGGQREALVDDAELAGTWDLASGRIGSAELYRLDTLSGLPLQ